MPDKKVNIIKIKKDYYTDLAYAESKMNNEEFIKRHTEGDKEKWEEMRYVAFQPFFLHSFLLNLKVGQRLQALKEMSGYTFEDIKKLGHIGGSIYEYFDSKSKNVEVFKFSAQRAKLAIIMDIPIVYLLKDKPTLAESKQYNFLEYHEEGKNINFTELNDILVRPKKREIQVFKVMNNLMTNPFYEGLVEETELNCRVDLHKTFFSLEFHFKSRLNVNIHSIKWIVDNFDTKISRVILSIPPLRDTFKLSVIGVYIPEQEKDALMFADKLIKVNNGDLLFPYDYSFEKVVPN